MSTFHLLSTIDFILPCLLGATSSVKIFLGGYGAAFVLPRADFCVWPPAIRESRFN